MVIHYKNRNAFVYTIFSYSSEMAVSSLALLQSTFENMNAFKPGSQKKTSQLQVAIAGSEEVS